VLLAKSKIKDKPPLTLLQHSHDVANVAEWMFGTPTKPTRLGCVWLRFFKVDMNQFVLFHNNLQAAAAFHDWGKANDGFQGALTHGKTQLIRHEHLSGMLLALPGVSAWLRSAPGLDCDIVLAAVLSHHLKIKDETFAPQQGDQFQLRLLTDDSDFAPMLAELADRLGLSTPRVDLPQFWCFPDGNNPLPPGAFDLVSHREIVKDRLMLFARHLRRDDARKRLLWAVRSALVASDAAASGLTRQGKEIQSWLHDAFADEAILTRDFVTSNVIERRRAELEKLGSWKNWSDFQTACDRLPSRSLLLAPCGSGKTLAAWRWIAAQLESRPAARVLFLYPTRATAKEGFRDYVAWAPESAASLMHGTSAFDLHDMFVNLDDPRRESRYEVEARLFSLGFWSKRIFSATVDQFLAFMQYSYGAVCMLPVLADAVVVIDEVHSFDRSMFAALKDFLTHFDVPVLCMTATLPNDRRDQLKDCGLQVYDDKPGELKIIADAPRYTLSRTTAAAVPPMILEAARNGGRVLWVVNTVRRAQDAVLQLAGDFQPSRMQDRLHLADNICLLCYHSRFKLSDRVARHNDVVNAFRKDQPAVVGVSTQVCEMSLDMDADLLITEECPITSLIQRMGRCNRERNPRSLDRSGEIVVYKPETPAPYEPEDLLGLEAFLQMLAGREAFHQGDLERALADAPQRPPMGDKACSFVQSGAYAFGVDEAFRDGDEYSVQAVLKNEVDDFLRAGNQHRPGWIVSVPRKHVRQARDARLPRYLAVAPAGHYHGALGFCDREVKELGGNQ
jgi:CRISPR-associated endonuclease/helicase Cas3